MKLNSVSSSQYKNNILSENKKATKLNLQKQPSFGSFGSALGKLNNVFEFEGFNMSWWCLALVSFGAIMAPRLIQARDNTERAEILQRDVITILTMLMGTHILNNMMSAISQKTSGLALMNEDRNAPWYKKAFNFFNPVNGTSIMSSEQIIAHYSKVEEYKDGFNGFVKFINDNGGDIKKLLASDEKTKQMTEVIYQATKENKDIDIDRLKNLVSNEKVAKLKEKPEFIKLSKDKLAKMFNDLSESDNGKEALKQMCQVFDNASNKFVVKGKFLNGIFNLAATFVLVPVFLGVLLPMANEKLARKVLKEQGLSTNEMPSIMTQNQNNENNSKVDAKA